MSLPTYSRFIFSIILIMSLCFSSYNRNKLWIDDTLLWLDASNKSPDKIRTRSNLGYAYNINGFYDKAIQEYKNILAHGENDSPSLYLNLGAALQLKGSTEEAILAFQKAIAQAPYFADAHANLGAVYKDMGLIDAGIQELEIAVKLNPVSAKIRNNLGIAYIKKGFIDLALKELEFAAELNPDIFDVHFNLAYAYTKKRMLDKAIKEYAAALKLKPDDIETRQNLETLKMIVQ